MKSIIRYNVMASKTKKLHLRKGCSYDDKVGKLRSRFSGGTHRLNKILMDHLIAEDAIVIREFNKAIASRTGPWAWECFGKAVNARFTQRECFLIGAFCAAIMADDKETADILEERLAMLGKRSSTSSDVWPSHSGA